MKTAGILCSKNIPLICCCFFSFTHTHTHTHTHTSVYSGPGFGSDISEMVGTPASSVSEMGKALTPDGVIMSDGSLSHTDLMDMPVSKSATIAMYMYMSSVYRMHLVMLLKAL